MMQKTELNKCFACKSAAIVTLPVGGRDIYIVQCPNCGNFEIAGTAAAGLKQYLHYPLLSEALNKLPANEIPCLLTANLCEIIEKAGLHDGVKEQAESLLKHIYQKELETKRYLGVPAASIDNLIIDIERLATPEYEYAILASWILLHEKGADRYAIVMTEKGETRAKKLMETGDE